MTADFEHEILMREREKLRFACNRYVDTVLPSKQNNIQPNTDYSNAVG